MMKRNGFFIILISVVLSAAASFAVVKCAGDSAQKGDSPMPVYGGRAADAPAVNIDIEGRSFPDFTFAAENSVEAVVYVKVLKRENKSREATILDYFFGVPQYAQPRESVNSGSGVILYDNGYIVTNNHVVEGASSLSVGFIDESTVEGSVKGTDADNDLAVVSVKLSDIPDDTMKQIKIATVGNSDDLELGEQVVAIGNALGYGQSVTCGYVSALDRDLTLTDESGATINSTGLIQTDAAINPGNSGGALLNMKGELIGINEAKTASTPDGSSVDNIGFAIPIDKAESSIKDLMNLPTREKVDESQASYLGIQGSSVTSDITQLYGIPEGVAVSEVVENGPADAAGIQNGDVITELDGRTISNIEQLQDTLQYYAAGETVKVTVQRQENGSYQAEEATVTLGSAEAENQ